MKTTLNEIVKVCGVVTSGDQRKHVLLASTCFFSLGFPSKLYLTSLILWVISLFPKAKARKTLIFPEWYL